MRSVKFFFFCLSLLVFVPMAHGVALGAPAAATPSTAPPFEPAEDLKLTPGERFLKLLQKSPGVTLGSSHDAPLIFALVLPGSPACKSFWGKIRDSVATGKVTLRLFPAGLTDSDDERVGAMLLRSPDPMKAWDRYASGDASALAGKPDAASRDKVGTNTALIDRWQIPVAPYLVYRARNGQVKVVEGVPADINAVIADAMPANTEAGPL